MTGVWLLGWWNLIFLVPFGLALLYLGVYTLSGWSFGEDADVDTDFDADVIADLDADTDLDTDIDADHDLSVEHDVDAESDADTDTDAETHQPASLGSALSFLGVGRVPLSMVLMFLLFIWGGIGFVTNQIAQPWVAMPWHVAFFSIPLAAIGSLLLTGAISSAIDRFMPLNVTHAKRRHQLLGSCGQVILPIDQRFGMASVRDADSGDLFQVPCRLQGTGQPVPKGAHVKLIAYDSRASLFYVLPDASLD